MNMWCSRTAALIVTMVAALGVWPQSARAESPQSREGVIKELMTRKVAQVPNKEIRLLTVEYLPGGASLPHRHNAQVFVYVLEGNVTMQVQGSVAVTLHPGDTFYEGPNDIHTVSANASQTEPARILVFIVKAKGTPIAMPLDHTRTP